MEKQIEEAIEFAKQKHSTQKRKYEGMPYIVHPLRVAEIVSTRTDSVQAYIAAILHDTIEDTDATLKEVQERFGDEVADLVWQLTDRSKPSDGNRAKRKAIDRESLVKASPLAQTVKMADIIDNAPSIIEHDPGFARRYLMECLALVKALKKADPVLRERARKLAEDFLKTH